MKNILAIALLTLSIGTFAADSGSSGGDSDSDKRLDINAEMTQARAYINDKKYRAAIRLLNGVIHQEYRNADAWNLLGYSHRKMGKLKKASKAYGKALKFDPQHKGALEYQGELFIELQDYDRAHENLSKLTALCPKGCEELSDLSEALAR